MRQRFIIQEDVTTEGKFILLKKPTKPNKPALPVCTKENLYNTLCEIYIASGNPGMTAFWSKISSQYSYIPQHLSECFVKHCKKNKNSKMPTSVKPAVATNMMEFEVNKIIML